MSKGVGYCFSLEVEKTSHLTSTVHSNQTNMADGSDLFLFGDDFDAILEIMEAEDNIDVHFEDAVAEVQKDDIECQHCHKRCKSRSGLKRHITAKHKTFGETSDATSEGKHQCQFTSEVLDCQGMLQPCFLLHLLTTCCPTVRNKSVPTLQHLVPS